MLAPTKVDIPCDFDANKKTVLRMFGYEKKLTISQAKWGDCALEGLNFVKQERDYGNSEIKLERTKVITTRVFASLRNLIGVQNRTLQAEIGRGALSIGFDYFGLSQDSGRY